MRSPPSRPTGRHHYVPCFYLAHFTEEWASGCSPDEAKIGRLHVFDLETGQQRPSKPVNEGYERDFYLIEGAEPLGVEDTLAKIENLVAPLLRDIARLKALPEQPERLSELPLSLSSVHGCLTRAEFTKTSTISLAASSSMWSPIPTLLSMAR